MPTLDLDKKQVDTLRLKLIKDMADDRGMPMPEPGDCVSCGAKPPQVFRADEDPIEGEKSRSELDFDITGFCQKCQDDMEKLPDDLSKELLTE